MLSPVASSDGARIPGGSAGEAVPALGFTSRVLTGDLCWPLWPTSVGDAEVDAAGAALDGDNFDEATGKRKKEFNVVDLECAFLLLFEC